jgi:hypothetical protein
MTLTVYSRAGCHLCDEMKAVVTRVAGAFRLASLLVEEIDVSSDATLEDRFGQEVPVLAIDGEKVAKYRVADEALRRMVQARLRAER